MLAWDKNISDGVLKGLQPTEYADTWVTLFGFAPEYLPIVLREFLHCGDIINYDIHEKGPAGNWVHVQFRVMNDGLICGIFAFLNC